MPPRMSECARTTVPTATEGTATDSHTRWALCPSMLQNGTAVPPSHSWWPRSDMMGAKQPSCWAKLTARPSSSRLAGQLWLGQIQFLFHFQIPFYSRNHCKLQNSVENCIKLIKMQNNFFLEYLWVDLSRKLDLIVIFSISLCIKI
jgi:hypothetical protein